MHIPLGAGIYEITSYLFDGIVIPWQYHIDANSCRLFVKKRTAITKDPSPAFSVMESFVRATPSFASLDMAHLPWDTAEDY